MYHLCFSSFIQVLLLTQNPTKQIKQTKFVREFLSVFNESLDSYSKTLIGYLMSRSRNVSRNLIEKLEVVKMEDSSISLNYFAQKYLSGESEITKKRILNLIKNSQNISNMDKNKLIYVINNDDTYNFLKEVFYFIIENTTNVSLKIKNSEELQKAIVNTEDNSELEKLCLIAFDMKDENAMFLCFEKMTNAVHISRVIEYAIENKFHDDELMKDFIDKMISKITNNVYLDRIFKVYLLEDSISYEDKVIVIEKHFNQIENNKYKFDVLSFMYKNNFKEETLKYKDRLKNKTYIERLNQLIRENSIDKT